MENIQVLKYLDFEFIFDKENTFMWVMQKWQALSMELVKELSNLFDDDELFDFLDNTEDVIYKLRFNYWLKCFDRTYKTINIKGIWLYKIIDEDWYNKYIDSHEQSPDYKFLEDQKILSIIF